MSRSTAGVRDGPELGICYDESGKSQAPLFKWQAIHALAALPGSDFCSWGIRRATNKWYAFIASAGSRPVGDFFACDSHRPKPPTDFAELLPEASNSAIGHVDILVHADDPSLVAVHR